jgi:hypothetical protein
LHSSEANGKQGPIPEEMSQTVLTKKRGNLDYIHASKTLFSQRKLAYAARNTLFALEIIGAPKKFKKMAPPPI